MTYSCDTVSEACPIVTPATVAPVAGLLINVNDQLGRSLNFTYDASSRLATMTNPAGVVYAFTYSPEDNNNLTAVTYPDGKVNTFHYENPTFPHALTGITNENGNRYATWTYDEAGKAISSEHAGGVEKFTLVYNTNGPFYAPNPISTVVTDPRGSKRTYNFTNILGVVKSTGQSQPSGSGCSASAAAFTYDVNGNVSSRNDFDEHRSTYQYDLNRNLETSRTEGLTATGLTTDATRTITTTWHPTWRLPLVISEYTGATPTGTPVKKTTQVYDAKGNLTSITETDPVRRLNRTTAITYTYSADLPGLVLTKVVNGPRADVNDMTTYSYYPHDAVCADSSAAPIDPANPVPNFGCRGQLQSVKNALNQTTTYNRYNHHGQVEQLTDANGLMTQHTYDLRQRLTSRKVGNETTTLSYDNAGQIIQLQMPDSSVLNYTYDAAHRLTQVQDTLGNKVVYTLDTEGNRTQEDTKDPKGNLAKTLTRSYDALSRLQTVTGIE
jgi:YD repeat-containing protein